LHTCSFPSLYSGVLTKNLVHVIFGEML
jgi:hypothetical protein